MPRFLLLVKRIIQFIARQILLFILPIPLFSNLSAVLARSVGIDLLSLKPLFKPIQIQSITTNLTRFVPTFLMPKPIQTKAIPVEPTLSLGEKIRTWRQRGIAANATKNGKEASEGEEEFHVQSKMNTRK